jgi:osmoprotectant transport system permease protein
VNSFVDAIAWVLDPANWGGPGGIAVRLAQHLAVATLVLVLAAAIALPLGMLVGHTGRGKQAAVMVSGGLRALPTLGVLTLFGLWLGIGLRAPVLALLILAIPPLLAGAYAGFESVDRRTIDAARAMGMREGQIVARVELPISLPILVGGVRSAALQIIATATLAAYLADEGLGRFLFDGLKTRDYAEMLGGSLLVIALALVVDGVFALVQRFVVPRGVRLARTSRGGVAEAGSPATRRPTTARRTITEGNPT